jgi:hypothetical protein
MKKWWFGEKKHIDQQKREARKKALTDLQQLIENGDEEGFVDYLKALKPDLTKQELIDFVKQFRDERSRKQRGGA